MSGLNQKQSLKKNVAWLHIQTMIKKMIKCFYFWGRKKKETKTNKQTNNNPKNFNPNNKEDL